MNRIAILGASLIAGVGASIGRSFGGSGVVTIRDDRPRESALRRFVSRRQPKRGGHVPHYGKKEQERAKRFEMSNAHANFPYGVRSAPTMQRISNRDYADMLDVRRADAA